MSGITSKGIWSSLDPLDILGKSGSSVLDNVVDPLDILGKNPKVGNTPPNPNINPATGTNYTATQGVLPPNYLGANSGLPNVTLISGVPSMQGYGYSYYGGQAPAPQGGYYNQMAQAMAGPSYAPAGTSWIPGAQAMPAPSYAPAGTSWIPGAVAAKGAAQSQIPASGTVLTQSPFGNPLNPASLNPNFSPTAATQPASNAPGPTVATQPASNAPRPNSSGASGRGLAGQISRLDLTHVF